jgi:hypothetical protein
MSRLLPLFLNFNKLFVKLNCYQKTNMFDFRKVGMHQKWKIRMHDSTAILF